MIETTQYKIGYLDVNKADLDETWGGGILPTSLQELPIHLRDLKNNKKSLTTYFLGFDNK